MNCSAVSRCFDVIRQNNAVPISELVKISWFYKHAHINLNIQSVNRPGTHLDVGWMEVLSIVELMLVLCWCLDTDMSAVNATYYYYSISISLAKCLLCFVGFLLIRKPYPLMRPKQERFGDTWNRSSLTCCKAPLYHVHCVYIDLYILCELHVELRGSF